MEATAWHDGRDERAERGSPRDARLRLVGEDTAVPNVLGTTSRSVNFDYAATTPCLAEVEAELSDLLAYYASVHRGAGYKPELASALYESARQRIGRFFGARDDDAVVLTSGTTSALNLLAATLDKRRVLVHDVEHHANLLPWRCHGHDVTVVPTPKTPEAMLAGVEDRLERDKADLVAVTGASNVTGEVWPLAELAEVVHRFGARLVVDAAQLSAHRRISIAESGVDYLAFSGHKVYAPFGAGALIGRNDWLEEGRPYRCGGGAVDYVSTDEVLWSASPARHEAGSPNFVGVVALASTLARLEACGVGSVFAEESRLMDGARARLEEIAGVKVLRCWPRSAERVGVVAFTIDGVDHGLVAAVLGAEWNIAVRAGRFCAHPFVARLLGVTEDELGLIRRHRQAGELVELPGAVRASAGLGTTAADVDLLVEAITEIAARRWRWSYRRDDRTGLWRPDPDGRPSSATAAPRIATILATIRG